MSIPNYGLYECIEGKEKNALKRCEYKKASHYRFLKRFVKLADDAKENDAEAYSNTFYINEDGKLGLIAKNLGNVDQCMWLGFSAVYTDMDGNLLVHTCITHDFNFIKVLRMGDLLFAIEETKFEYNSISDYY